MSGTTINISLNVLCDQRKKQSFFNIPQFRFTPISPYTGQYTKFQLDMRRKAEILKYSNTSSSTKTNNLTKSQKYAQLVNGNLPTQTQSFQNKIYTLLDGSGKYNILTVRWSDKLNLIPSNSADPNAVQIKEIPGFFTYNISRNYYSPNCAKDRLKPTPTYASGITGGPVINLIDDESVPLYHYTNDSINSASYAVGQTLNNALWDIYSYQNISISSITNKNIASFIVKPAINKQKYTYGLQIPLGVYFKILPTSAVTVKIVNVNFSVYYSGKLVNETNLPHQFLKTKTSTLSITIPLSDIKRITTTETGNNYFALLDILQINSILLSTLSGYTYDFFLELTINDSTDDTVVTYDIVANYDNSYKSAISVISSST